MTKNIIYTKSKSSKVSNALNVPLPNPFRNFKTLNLPISYALPKFHVNGLHDLANFDIIALPLGDTQLFAIQLLIVLLLHLYVYPPFSNINPQTNVQTNDQIKSKIITDLGVVSWWRIITKLQKRIKSKKQECNGTSVGPTTRRKLLCNTCIDL